MKKYYVLTICGNEELIVNGKVLDYDHYYFKEYDREKIIGVLKQIHSVEPLEVGSYAIAAASNFKNHLFNMKKFIEYWEPEENISISKNYGLHQYVSFTSNYMPTEEDWS